MASGGGSRRSQPNRRDGHRPAISSRDATGPGRVFHPSRRDTSSASPSPASPSETDEWTARAKSLARVGWGDGCCEAARGVATRSHQCDSVRICPTTPLGSTVYACASGEGEERAVRDGHADPRHSRAGSLRARSTLDKDVSGCQELALDLRHAQRISAGTPPTLSDPCLANALKQWIGISLARHGHCLIPAIQHTCHELISSMCAEDKGRGSGETWMNEAVSA